MDVLIDRQEWDGIAQPTNQKMNIVRAALTVGSLTMVSRITGFVREILIAAILGAGWQADAFFVSFKLANFLRRFFAEGAFSASFVPIFSRTMEAEGEDAARKFGSAALSVLSMLLLIVVLLAELFMPWLVRVLAAGFDPDGDPRFLLAVELSRITFPYLFFVSIAALLSGVLNAIGKFAAAAFAPVLLNLTLIAALLMSALTSGDTVQWLAYGVALAGILQLSWLLAAARRNGMILIPHAPRLTPRIKRLFALMGPAALGSGVQQISLLIDTWFATHLAAGSVAYLFFADRIIQLPVGLIGVALATVLLPTLSKQYRAGQSAVAVATQNRAIEYGMLMVVPAAAALLTVSGPVVSALYARGAFDQAAALATSQTVAAFALGLPAYVLVKILVPAFFAREDTKTSVKIAFVALLSNVGLILILIDSLAHVGIALATALSNWINALLLLVILRRQGLRVLDRKVAVKLAKIVTASATMTASLMLVQMSPVGTMGLFGFGVTIVVGGTVYSLACLLLRLIGPEDVRKLLAQKWGAPE